ncbi:SDR family oxidoreductase [Agaribacter marinus]|uniref:Short-chain dehydrogenase/reductase n=1 Tax=Agaribacter marinus TaxID=1431249 RepID=A0AA37WGP8_9ALTE|nr:SDR family oxidoreductase [Agaribacter marinus]GLR70381.1 short-chain dehydrogenase/reductase [Agaribacter marinus]
MHKIALITGTSTGLGYSLTIKLAALGYQVFATMRNLSKAEKLRSEISDKGLPVEILPLDVQDEQSVKTCIASVIAKTGKIDVLINNAGAGFVKTTEHATPEEIDWVMDVNFHGVVRCTKAVLPHMREARRGHIINITSVGGLVGQPFNEFYCAAKFAVEGYTESLASYVQPTFGIHFSVVEPGGISSEFANSVLTQLEQTGGMPQGDYLPVLQQYISNAQSRAANNGAYQSADEVADKVIEVLTNDNPPIRVRTSEWAENFAKLKTQADPDGKKIQQQIVETIL